MAHPLSSSYNRRAAMVDPTSSYQAIPGNKITYPVTGYVMDAYDPLEYGRIRVFCPMLGDDPRNPLLAPFAMACPPYHGIIDNAAAIRSHTASTTEGHVSYGFQGVPEVGAMVVVMCLEGDPNRRVWMGCIPEPSATHTYGHGRYKWSESALADGPFSGKDGAKIEPLYSNLAAQFQDKKLSPEWRTRGADLPSSANREPTGHAEKVVDQKWEDIKAALLGASGPGHELRKHEAESQPVSIAPGYGWSMLGVAPWSARRVQRVYGMTTPGFHALTMDDRPANCRIRVRTTSGAQILLDDTNERIYVSTPQGNNYFEMDYTTGNVEGYSKGRFSWHAEDDINLTSDKTIRMHAKQGIHAVAGEQKVAVADENLSEVLQAGEIRLHSMHDMHVYSDKNIRTTSGEDTRITVMGNYHSKTYGEHMQYSDKNMNLVSAKGSVLTNAGENVVSISNMDTIIYANNDLKLSADVNTEVNAFSGTLDMGAQSTIKMISESGNVETKVVESGKSIKLKTPENEILMGEAGIRQATKGDAVTEAASSVELKQGTTQMDASEQQEDAQTFDGNCNLDGPVDIEGLQGADLAAALAYNAGFRGVDLLNATALAGAESAFKPDAANESPTDKGYDKRGNYWVGSFGMWQIRCLEDPSVGNVTDSYRVREDMLDPVKNAEQAYRIYKDSGNSFNQWGAWTNKTKAWGPAMEAAKGALARLCGEQFNPAASGASDPSTGGEGAGVAGAAPGSPGVLPAPLPISDVEPISFDIDPNLDLDDMATSVLKITSDKVKIQGMNDLDLTVKVKDLRTSLTCIDSKLDDIVLTFNSTTGEIFEQIRAGNKWLENYLKDMLGDMITNLWVAWAGPDAPGAEAAMIAQIAKITDRIDQLSELLSYINDIIVLKDRILNFPNDLANAVKGVEYLIKNLQIDLNLSLPMPNIINQFQPIVDSIYKLSRDIEHLADGGTLPLSVDFLREDPNCD